MAILVDLEAEAPPAAAFVDSRPVAELSTAVPSTFASIFSCFPIVAGITGRLDLNDVDSLSLSCQQVRANLIQFRSRILQHSLHCEADGAQQRCARDLVEFCRGANCSGSLCRNCIRDASSGAIFVDYDVARPLDVDRRLRRLCESCRAAPLELLIQPLRHHTNPLRGNMFCACDGLATGFCSDCRYDIAHQQPPYLDIDAWANPWTAMNRYEASLRASLQGLEERMQIDHNGPRYDGVECAMLERCVAAGAVSTFSGMKSRLTGASVYEADHLELVNPGKPLSEVDWLNFLHEERVGDVRGWCNWCEKIVLSDSDKKTWRLL